MKKDKTAQVTIEYIVIFLLVAVVIVAKIITFLPCLYQASEELRDKAIEGIVKPPER